jgi:hypothetical protein
MKFSEKSASKNTEKGFSPTALRHQGACTEKPRQEARHKRIAAEDNCGQP